MLNQSKFEIQIFNLKSKSQSIFKLHLQSNQFRILNQFKSQLSSLKIQTRYLNFPSLFPLGRRPSSSFSLCVEPIWNQAQPAHLLFPISLPCLLLLYSCPSQHQCLPGRTSSCLAAPCSYLPLATPRRAPRPRAGAMRTVIPAHTTLVHTHPCPHCARASLSPSSLPHSRVTISTHHQCCHLCCHHHRRSRSCLRHLDPTFLYKSEHRHLIHPLHTPLISHSLRSTIVAARSSSRASAAPPVSPPHRFGENFATTTASRRVPKDLDYFP